MSFVHLIYIIYLWQMTSYRDAYEHLFVGLAENEKKEKLMN